MTGPVSRLMRRTGFVRRLFDNGASVAERAAARQLTPANASCRPEWAAAVPALIPRFAQCRHPATGFDMRKALLQETHGFFAIVPVVFVLDSEKGSFAARLPVVSGTWLPAFLLTGLASLGATIAEKRRAAKPTAQYPWPQATSASSPASGRRNPRGSGTCRGLISGRGPRRARRYLALLKSAFLRFSKTSATAALARSKLILPSRSTSRRTLAERATPLSVT